MNVLFDADVILDVLLDRDPYEAHAYKLLTLVEKGHVTGWLVSGTMNTLHFLMSKEVEPKWVKRHLLEVLDIFQIIPITSHIMEMAIKSSFKDYEDAVLNQAALEQKVDYIVTRNKTVFKDSKVPVYHPEEFLNILESLH
ncbi:MAG: PIN domain-containing protein [Balneolales bacterium]